MSPVINLGQAYELQLESINSSEITISSFTAEEGIAEIFCYTIDFVSENQLIDPQMVLNKKATFIYHESDEPPRVHGIISSFRQKGTLGGLVNYSVELVPRLWRLSLTHQSTVYQNISILDLIESILTDAELIDSREIRINGFYPEKDYIVQYNETNLDFLNRQLEHYGISYFFQHNLEKEIIVFTDSKSCRYHEF